MLKFRLRSLKTSAEASVQLIIAVCEQLLLRDFGKDLTTETQKTVSYEVTNAKPEVEYILISVNSVYGKKWG